MFLMPKFSSKRERKEHNERVIMYLEMCLETLDMTPETEAFIRGRIEVLGASVEAYKARRIGKNTNKPRRHIKGYSGGK